MPPASRSTLTDVLSRPKVPCRVMPRITSFVHRHGKTHLSSHRLSPRCRLRRNRPSRSSPRSRLRRRAAAAAPPEPPCCPCPSYRRPPSYHGNPARKRRVRACGCECDSSPISRCITLSPVEGTTAWQGSLPMKLEHEPHGLPKPPPSPPWSSYTTPLTRISPPPARPSRPFPSLPVCPRCPPGLSV